MTAENIGDSPKDVATKPASSSRDTSLVSVAGVWSMRYPLARDNDSVEIKNKAAAVGDVSRSLVSHSTAPWNVCIGRDVDHRFNGFPIKFQPYLDVRPASEHRGMNRTLM